MEANRTERHEMSDFNAPTHANLDRLIEAAQQCADANMWDQHEYIISKYHKMLSKLS